MRMFADPRCTYRNGRKLFIVAPLRCAPASTPANQYRVCRGPRPPPQQTNTGFAGGPGLRRAEGIVCQLTQGLSFGSLTLASERAWATIMPRLPALHSSGGWCFVASGSIFETDAKSHSPQRARRAQQKGKTYHRGGDAKEIAVIARDRKSKPLPLTTLIALISAELGNEIYRNGRGGHNGKPGTTPTSQTHPGGGNSRRCKTTRR
jgi:hypothetical protein